MGAGIALLTEHGWPAVTTRGVAERAGTNPGLIHYHFGGLPGLHAAIARAAGELVIGPLVTELLGAVDARAALGRIRDMLGETTGDERATRLAVEVIAGAARDPALGEVLREQLRQARGQIGEALGRMHPEWPAERRAGVAVLVTAAVDGLMLHYLLDPGLPVGQAVSAAEGLLS
ncbi:TetR/AcrR family transcriptional regulator [Nonomuraea endophytica]|uniref:AcrR family transcriptional regulator n=1 Tax=Nonomuraea endophytica TaxID=714136 RepID=A0A7W8AGS9_9ACTN|nr:TetR/AcrR family transcriptional regulator [Nonomuraea endophytica]MBB5084558.1 AcrR family transcriptional regulator [Nonomuraea endophytica]